MKKYFNKKVVGALLALASAVGLLTTDQAALVDGISQIFLTEAGN